MSGFFDRMAANAPADRRQCRQEQSGEQFQLIKRHLETLLNARRGCSQSSPELGLPDFNGHEPNGGRLLEKMTADIRNTIRRYEPRIQIRALHAVPDPNAPLELHFRLDCQVQVGSRAEQLQIELLINGHNRHTRVR